MRLTRLLRENILCPCDIDFIKTMATIKDVAVKAGLSVTTVSRFLNNHPYISEDKKEKILAAMKELDYEPSTVAQQMRENPPDWRAYLKDNQPFFCQPGRRP